MNQVPENISDDEAAVFGVSVITCGQALYQSLGLPLPETDPYGGYVLIYGGSTGTGILAIQYAVLYVCHSDPTLSMNPLINSLSRSGAKVVATASESNFPLLKSLGAEETFDYKDPDCGAKIRSYTQDSLKLALDCISEGNSPHICEEAISSRGGTISYLLKSANHTRKDIVKKHTSGYRVLGESFDKLGEHVDASPGEYEFCKEWWKITEGLVRDGKLKPHPIKVGPDGLIGVFDGMQQQREGKVSGVKLVYRVGETP